MLEYQKYKPYFLKAIKIAKSRLGVGFLVLIFIYLCINYNFLFLFGKTPSFEDLEEPPLVVASELYATDGEMIGRYYKENRTQVQYNQIPKHFFNALIATEDIRFYEHNGVDWSATLSVIWFSMKGDKRGGSTITQQLAKNLFKTRKEESKGLLGYIPLVNTVVYKLKEWIIATKLEMTYSKEDILRLYSNTVDFGGNTFGIKTAAKSFFDKKTIDLTVEEAALMVGVLKAPTFYSPIRNPKNAFRRRNTVLKQMVKYGYLTQKVGDSLSSIPIALKLNKDLILEGKALYMRGVVRKFLEKFCDDKGYDLYGDGLKIYSTIDSRLQSYGEEAVNQHMATLQASFFRHWKGHNPLEGRQLNEQEGQEIFQSNIEALPIYKILKKRYKNNKDSIYAVLNRPKRMTVFTWETPEGEIDTTFSTIDSLLYYKHFLHAGFLAIDPHTGHVKSWVGGINYKYFKYDHVYQSKRHPGSTFKPFVYCTALKQGYSPCDVMIDRPVTIHYEEDGQQMMWSPRNSDRVYTGDSMSLRWAMARSVNTITAQLSVKVTPDSIVKTAHKCGIESYIKSVPSVGLGTNDVTLMEMVGAYSTFVNKGEWIRPTYITKIVDRDGKVIYQSKEIRKKALDPEIAWLMIHMLKGGVEEPGGTAQALFSYNIFRGNEVGGKTGTSSDLADGWFMGITKDLVVGSWVGANDRRVHFRSGNYGEGMKTALPICGIFLEKVYTDKESGYKKGYFPKPPKTLNIRYNCPTRRPKRDTLSTDSLGILLPDSLIKVEEPLKAIQMQLE